LFTNPVYVAVNVGLLERYCLLTLFAVTVSIALVTVRTPVAELAAYVDVPPYVALSAWSPAITVGTGNNAMLLPLSDFVHVVVGPLDTNVTVPEVGVPEEPVTVTVTVPVPYVDNGALIVVVVVVVLSLMSRAT
jgi:hypothetical protein